MIKEYTLTPEESARIEKLEQLTPQELKDYHKFLLSLPEAENQKEARANDADIDAYLGVTQITHGKEMAKRYLKRKVKKLIRFSVRLLTIYLIYALCYAVAYQL